MRCRGVLALGVDVGSVRRRGGFAWGAADGSIEGEDDPEALGLAVIAALEKGLRVAMAFECPLSVPIPTSVDEGWRALGQARTGEASRPWSASPGAAAMATGLAQLSWVLAFVRSGSALPPRTTTQKSRFGKCDLLIAEAMVTSDGKPEPVDGRQDHADAIAAALRLAELVAPTTAAAGIPDVSCAPHVPLNLAAVAALHAGLPIAVDELHLDVLVAKARPRPTRDGEPGVE